MFLSSLHYESTACGGKICLYLWDNDFPHFFFIARTFWSFWKHGNDDDFLEVFPKKKKRARNMSRSLFILRACEMNETAAHIPNSTPKEIAHFQATFANGVLKCVTHGKGLKWVKDLKPSCQSKAIAIAISISHYTRYSNQNSDLTQNSTPL